MCIATKVNKFIIDDFSRNPLKFNDTAGFTPIKETLYDILSNNHPSTIYFGFRYNEDSLIFIVDEKDSYLYQVYESDINDDDSVEDNYDRYIQEIKILHQGIYRDNQIKKI